MFFKEAPGVIYTVLAPQTGTRHRILIPWTLAGATYVVKKPPRKERLGTLLSETTQSQQSETVVKKVAVIHRGEVQK